MSVAPPPCTILVETHAHTAEVSACSQLPAQALVALAAANGYGALVVTDHYLAGQTDTDAQRAAFMQGFLRAQEAGWQCGIVILPGMELRFEGHGFNDFLVYLPDPALYTKLKGLASMSPRSFRRLADDAGMLIYQAHPFRPGLHPEPPDCLHGIEVHNGNPNHDSHNSAALAYAQTHGLAMISGSDLHEPHGARRGGIWVPEGALTAESFVRYLRETPSPDMLRL